MDDIAVLGLAIDSSSVVTADRNLAKLPATAAIAEQSTKKLTAATAELGTALDATTRRRNQYDDAHTRSARVTAMAADATAAMAAVQRRVTTDITAGANAIALATRQADGFARAARQSAMDTGRAASRELMASVGVSTASIKAMYVGAATAASTAATTIVAANARVAASNASVGYMGRAGQVGLNSQQKVMLGYQMQDVFTSLASGMNPAVVAAQQGPQISMLYGGMGNMLRAIPKPLLVGGAAVAGVGAGLYGLNSLAEAQDTRRAQDRRFSSLLGGDGAGMFRDVAGMASAASVGVDKATESVEGFARATGSLGASRQAVLGIAESIEKLTKLGGANDNEAGAAREGVAGMLKQATVNAEQLKTVLANAPGIADQIAAGLGVSVTQLRLMAEAGDLTNKKVFDALLSRSSAVNAEFERMPKSIGDLFSSIGTDLGMALKNLADSIPLVNQYRNALELAAKAANAIRESGMAETAQQVTARTSGAMGRGPAGLGLPGLSPGAAGGTAVAQRDFYAAQFDLSAQEVQAWAAAVRSAVKAADESLVTAMGIARKFDPIGAGFRDSSREVEAMEKALADLQNGLTSLSAQEAAQQMGVLENALRRARQEAQNIDPALKSINDVNRRNEFRANDNTPAGMAVQSRIQDLVSQGSNRQDATTAALAEQQEKIADIVALKQQEAEAAGKITVAMGKGKQALIEAQTEAAVLAFIMANVGSNTEVAADQIKAFRDAVKTIFTEESKQGGVNAAKPLLDDLAGIAAAMKVVEQGAYAMKRAEAEAKAARSEDGTGGLQMQVFDARQGLADATALDGLRQEIELTNKLAAAAGDVAKQKGLQLEYDIKRAQQSAAPENREKLAIEMRAKAAADLRRDTAEGAVEIEKQVELTKQQADIVRSGNADYAAQIAMLQKKNELLAKGVDLASEEAQRQITGAGNLARANIDLDRAREAADATKRIWQNAYENIQAFGADMFYDIFSKGTLDGKTAAETLKNIFLRTFAEIAAAAIIRPIIQPIVQAATGAIGSVVGGGGGAAGSLGGGGGIGGILQSLGGTILQSQGGIGGILKGAGSWVGGLFGAGGGAATSGIVSGIPVMANAAGPLGSAAGGLASGVGASSGLSAAFAAVPVAGWIAAAAAIAKGILGPGNGKSIGGVVSTLLGPSPEEWMANPKRAAFDVLGPGGPVGAALLNAFGIHPFSDDIPPVIMNQEYGQVDYGSGRFGTSGGAWGSQAQAGNMQNPLNAMGQTMQSIFDALGGVKDATKVWGVAMESMSRQQGEWQFWNRTSYLMDPSGGKRQWGQGSNAGDIGLEQAGVAAAIESILGGAVGDISANIRKALEGVNKSGKDTFETLGTTVAEVMAFDDALKSVGKTTTDAEVALKQIDESFKGLYDTAAKYGLDFGQIDAKKNAERTRVGTDFIGAIDRQFMDPVTAALTDIGDERTNLLRNNSALIGVEGYLDQANRIEELYAKKRLAIIEESGRAAAEAQQRAADLAATRIQSLQDIIDRLTFGDLANPSPEVAFAGAKASYMATLAQANAGDATAIDRLGGITEAYANAGRSFNASGADYVSQNLQMRADLRGVQSAIAGGVGSGNNEMLNALLRTSAQQSALVQELINDNRQSREQIAALVAQLQREAA